VSKFVNWGHWVLAVTLTAWGVLGVFRSVQRHEALLWTLFDAALCALLVWGVATWANWAHALLVLFCGLVPLAFLLAGPGLNGVPKISEITAVMIAIAILCWLLQPAVRREYWRPERAQ
jgi:hypothetical protein